MAQSVDYEKLYKTIGYRFRDESILKTALTHSSYSSEKKIEYEHNNERLEFIGDGFVDAVVGTELFGLMDTAHEGVLSKVRAAVVCEESLSDAAAAIGLGDYLYLGKGEESTGGRKKASILADAFEALIGAVIIDGGYEAGRKVILRLLADKIRLGTEGKLNKDYKTALQEKLQETEHDLKLKYVIAEESGPDHDKTFVIDVIINGRTAGTGKGKSKAKAEQAAAKDALLKGVC